MLTLALPVLVTFKVQVFIFDNEPTIFCHNIMHPPHERRKSSSRLSTGR